MIYTSAAKAERALRLPPGETLADRAHPDGQPYSVETFVPPTAEGDRGSYVLSAVFPRRSKLVVARQLATNTSARPSSHCAQLDQHALLALRFVGTTDRVGHFRLLREGVTDAPTLPPRTSGTCSERVTYRIEDHFIDLERGTYLAVYDQVYEDSVDASRELPGVAFDSFTVTALNIVPASCR